MAIIFSDSFTVASDTALTSHTPDIGTGYVQVAITGANVLQAKAADLCKLSGSGSGTGHYVKISPPPTTQDVSAQITLKALDTGAADRRVRIHARGNGTADYYALGILPTTHASNDIELFKVVANVKTSLGSIDTGIAINDILMLEITDTAKRVLKNGVQILTSADNSITGVGDVGLSIGQVSAADTGNGNTSWSLDDFIVTEIVPAGGILNIHNMTGNMQDLVGGIRG